MYKKFLNVIPNKREFFECLKICNNKYRSGHDLNYYRKIMELHRKFNNCLDSLWQKEEFYCLIMETLKKWNMNQRGARLTTIDKFKDSIRKNAEDLIKLSKLKLTRLNQALLNEIKPKLREIFSNLNVMETNSKIVGVSKTLHFLLPDLVMPIDRKFTLNFFQINLPSNPQREKEIFIDILQTFYDIAKSLALTENDVDGEKWNTSIPKLIDNAIIGYKLKNEVQYNQLISSNKNKSLPWLIPIHQSSSNKNYSLTF